MALGIGLCKVKRGAQLFQSVELAADGKTARGEDRYPTVEEDATIFAGAKVFGNVTVGKRAIIGANAVVNRSIPDDALAVGVPAKVIRINRPTPDAES